MKYSLIIDKARDEEITIICHEKTKLIEKIEGLVMTDQIEITGVENDNIVLINLDDVCCFISRNNNVYAMINEHEYKIKKRLYQIEEMQIVNFIKINQSCIANIDNIERFKASFNGALEVIFKNGYKDYISRREIKNVKERLGL